ncbi:MULTISPECIES: hypothetical protein [unclassified Bradyrhizobium]|uniref:hypothetical protein n=1 Tax=unclassified Bradyrhizobium TaxID=2631580 RepID=UPI001BA8503C|nr:MULTISPECIES: hypothetical protein [unclassified Bradyrhizobium]MBR1203884.1 hypothetical protein [Bradyrhizobium sp. AUGA SZCCT0124]MBR1310230.1 hypothetical protein [Bradyrhizobium sp. AUGA SZCCT0051]MBR1340371.1 hypothetical protein [Bradyrhizobium sp. AUGA SZCCT0105]MBR1354978.1 hypothetical protein [Bradyrhizobium sp. AUGA SZCCT0045]
MSAEIIQFIPRPRYEHDRTDFPTIAFRSVVPDPDIYDVDTAPSEYLPSDWEEK